MFDSLSSAPTYVLNIRLNVRGSVSVPRSSVDGPMTLLAVGRVDLQVGDDRRRGPSACRTAWRASRPSSRAARRRPRASRQARRTRPRSARPCRSAREDVDEDVELVGAIALLGRRQSTIGSLNPPTWPDASQTFGFMMIEQSSPTMSSRIVDVVAPPGVLDVPLQLDAERAVVPEAVDAAVDLARREDEPPALAERDQLVHVHRVVTFPEGA